MKLSIIIPFYKTDKEFFFAQLASLGNWNYGDCEIIVVSDASPDMESEFFVENMRAKDSRFRLFRQPVNRGVSAARNVGLLNASGEYVTFLDADDICHPEYYAGFIDRMEREDSQIGIFGVDILSKKNTVSVRYPDQLLDLSTDQDLAFLLHFRQGWVWNKIFHRSICSPGFDEELWFAEDGIFFFSALAQSKRVSLFYQCAYGYRYTPSNFNSVSFSQTGTEKYAWQILQIARKASVLHNHYMGRGKMVSRVILKEYVRNILCNSHQVLSRIPADRQKEYREETEKLWTAFAVPCQHNATFLQRFLIAVGNRGNFGCRLLNLCDKIDYRLFMRLALKRLSERR